jgi:uncharacterized protein (TIGR02217 family)
MTFMDTPFPPDIAYGSSGGPGFATDLVESLSGHEHRNSRWSAARARYNVAHGVQSESQWQALLAFFRACKGRAHAFRFKDWGDYRITGAQIGVGDGSRTQFQLVKQYTAGSTTETRTITKPVAGSINIYFNTTLQSSGFTVDVQTGVVAFSTAPTTGVSITVDAEFDVPVRFDTDYLPARLDHHGAYSLSDIPLIEIRE